MYPAYAASVLENALQRLSYDARESAFQRCDDILAEFCVWPFGQGVGASAGPVQIGGGQQRKRESIGAGRDSVQELVREVRKEMAAEQASAAGPGAGGGQEQEEELCFEVVATVLEIFARMDSLVRHDRKETLVTRRQILTKSCKAGSIYRFLLYIFWIVLYTSSMRNVHFTIDV